MGSVGAGGKAGCYCCALPSLLVLPFASAAYLDGRAEDNEYANVWRRSAQPGLWFGMGFVGMARFHSKFMTLLIKAIEEGIAPVDPDR
jgi:hypothetical protein